MIKLFDSLSQTNKPVANNQIVTIYLCGPTVYNYVHIGNVRPVLVFDVLHRLLLACGYQVNYVHNITDIDDKIIQKAQQTSQSESDISNFYFQEYCQNLTSLNVLPANQMPKVSNFIPQNIQFITKLIEKQLAYQTDNGVYFNVKLANNYGQLSNKNLTNLQTNLTVNDDVNKQHRDDFALWKVKNEGKSWPSPFGTGRPGWHTECATFIDNIFHQKTITIHGGGIDLKFPHHENERAQYWAQNHCEIANIWMHVGHVNLENQKMSKSNNHVLLVNDFLSQYHPFVLRYLLLNHEHQQPINFTALLIDEAQAVINKYHNFLKSWIFHRFLTTEQNDFSQAYQSDLYQSVIKKLINNLDLTNTFTMINQTVKLLNRALKSHNFSNEQQILFQTLLKIWTLLGFNFEVKCYDDATKIKIKQWKTAQQARNYQAADQIRVELQATGILPE